MKRFSFTILLLVCILIRNVNGQTVPAAQLLPYNQDFSSLASTSTTYPAGWQGWQLSTSGSSSAFRTTAATADLGLLASSTAATITGGVHNYNGKLGIMASSSSDPSLGLVVNTVGKVNILVTFDVSTIRNPFNGSTETRRNNVELQYRIGNTNGAFTSLTGSIYRNNTTAQTTGIVPRNGARYQYILPVNCENQSAVQLRWVQRDSSGTGSRPSFSIDNVIVCPAPVINASITPECNGADGAIQLNISAGVAPYSFSWDTINKNGPQFTVAATTKNAQHPYFGVGFPVGYVLDGIQGKELTLTRGVNYTFLGTFPGHPFHITTSASGGSFAGEVSAGITNSQLQGGAMVFTPGNVHPALLYYHCGVHLNMGWRTNITNGQLNTQNISGLSQGSYAVAVSSADGSIATATIIIPVGTPVDMEISSNSPVCEGQDIVVEASGGNTYSWSGPLGFSSSTDINLISSSTVLNGGYYTVTVNNSSGCSKTDSVEVIVHITPSVVSIIPDTAAVGSTVQITGTGLSDVNTIALNGSTAVPATSSFTDLTFVVPPLTATGPLTLTTTNNCSTTSGMELVILNISHLNLKCFIEGFYTGAQTMANALQDPLNPTHADSVTVALYDSSNIGAGPQYVSAGVITTGGQGSFSFPSAVNGQQYYIVVRHRNSIETWSKQPVLFGTTTNFSFTP